MTERELTLSLLTEWEEQGKYANLALSPRRLSALTPQESARVSARFYTVIEHLLTLDHLILALSARGREDVTPHTRRLLRLGLSELLYARSVPEHAAVFETVALAKNKGEAAFVNAVLREAIRRKDDLPLPDPKKNFARYLSVRYSTSLWIVKNYIQLYGKDGAESLLKAFGERQGYDLCVNPLRISRDAYIEKLTAAGIEAEPLLTQGVRLRKSYPVSALPGFFEGEFHVQDAASQIAVSVLSPRTGERVIDVAAAPGGKSFTAAEQMRDGGEVFSFDLHENKLSLLRTGAERLGLSSLRIAARDGRTPDPALIGTADRVLCDLPCSGLGVLGKKPDLRYKSEEEVRALPALQEEILAASAAYVRAGGILVYSTCTLRREENEEVVERFLSRAGDFSLVPFSIGGRAYDGLYTAFPPESGTDGFFIAKFQKKSEVDSL